MLQRITAEKALIVFLAVLGIVGAAATSAVAGADAWLQLAVAPLVAGVLDLLLIHAKTKRYEAPEHGIISGLIIALVLFPDPLRAAFAATIAIFSKHVIRWKGRNIFNPAAFGLVATMLVFATETTWWGASSPLALAGIIVALLIRRWETSIAFIASYAAVYSLLGAFTPFDYAIYFFAFVMVLEPVTTPAARLGKVAFGIFVALLTLLPSGADSLLLALLIANIFTPLFARFRLRKQGAEPDGGEQDTRRGERAEKVEEAQPALTGTHAKRRFSFPLIRKKAAKEAEQIQAAPAEKPPEEEKKEIREARPREAPEEAQEEPLFEEGELDRTGSELGDVMSSGKELSDEEVKEIIRKRRGSKEKP